MSSNRKSKVGGPGTGISLHSAGSISARQHADTLEKKLQRRPTWKEMFRHLHTHGHDGQSFVDQRSAKIDRRFPPRPDTSIDEDAVYLEVVPEVKGRVYGLGSQGYHRSISLGGASSSQGPAYGLHELEELQRDHQRLQETLLKERMERQEQMQRDKMERQEETQEMQDRRCDYFILRISNLLKKLKAIEKYPKVKLVILKVFAMPEASWGFFPDAGASHFLSRLPGFFGEYLGLTGARINGAEMLACGLATHFVPSTCLASLERELWKTNSVNPAVASAVLDVFAQEVSTREESAYRRIPCMSAITYKRSNVLQFSLYSYQEGRNQDVSQYLICEFRMACHAFHGTVNGDAFDSARTVSLDKNKKPKWQPSKLELVTDEMVDQFFAKIEDEDWAELRLPSKSSPAANSGLAKL
ncbi:hypothetical protein Syun_018318 [Stephania yunnanensis]|uniref:3-hydroxyisobutyryl-CoA hydrolase n=1 Tax=Stephania yunnanensis TaxID=152371 RepID=A0AAP0NY96_9MAGN